MGNVINANRQMMAVLDSQECVGKKLLLHACCAPCASACIERIYGKIDFDVFYYNPNIYTEQEYYKRAYELEKLMKSISPMAGLIVSDYDREPFLNMAEGLENEPERGRRCVACYGLRLKAARDKALDLGKDFFATTLTLSPLKSADVINSIGNSLSGDVKYLPTDFKKADGYKRSIEMSEEYGLYRQCFCGCEFSM